METSLKYGADTKSLRIHAKEKFPIRSNTLCRVKSQINGHQNWGSELRPCNDKILLLRVILSVGVGVQYDRSYDVDKVHYKICGKEAFPLTHDELMSLNIKGGCHIDENIREINYSRAAEFVRSIFNVKKGQDFRLKFGYSLTTKMECEVRPVRLIADSVSDNCDHDCFLTVSDLDQTFGCALVQTFGSRGEMIESM